jgi:SAM-dependent methyltransferase
MTDTKGYVDGDYLRQAARLFTPIKRRSHELLCLDRGMRVLDLGCGAGVDLPLLGDRVGAQGLTVGVDQDLSLAHQAAATGAIAVVATGEALPFADAEFHGCRAERVFMHLPAPTRVLAEMIRVVRPGGRVVVVETDWASCSLDCEEVELEVRLNRFRAEQMMHGGYAGRRLYGWFQRAGLAQVHCEISPLVVHDRQLYDRMARLGAVEAAALAAGVIDAPALARWRQGLAKAEEAGGFFGSVNVVTVVGCRPG